MRLVPFHFLHKMRMQTQWEMLLDLPEQIPSSSLIKCSYKSAGNAPGASWANSFKFPY